MNETIVVIVRGLIAFFTLLIFSRFLGKQNVSQLTFFEYVFGITIGSIAATLTSDLNTRAWPHFVALITWTAGVYVLQKVSMKWRYAAKYLEGEPTVVIMNGSIMEGAMRKMNYREMDLMAQLREKDVYDISQVEFAVLETDGKLSVLKKSQYQPVTPKDLDLSTNYAGIETELISNGKIIEENMKHVKLDEQWLKNELQKKGIQSIEEVFYAALDTEGNLYVDTYHDRVKNATNMSDYPGLH